MQRPVMNPTFLDDAPAVKRERWRVLRLIGRMLWGLVRLVFRVMTYDPLRRQLRIEDGSRAARFLRALGYRLVFVPAMIVGFVCLIVWQATHPRVPPSELHPSSVDVYYDAVTFVTSDNVQLEGSLYPVLSAKQVIDEQEKVLRKRYPAVVLVHDYGMQRDQMLPLVRPLHEAGFVVLAMNLRGTGASGAAANTFGIREALDVKAAVEMLRRRPFVDPSRVVVVGSGTGATAALIHCKIDRAIPALVVTDPIRSVETLLETKLAPKHEYLQWMAPLCKWTFEISYQLDVDDMQWTEFETLFMTRPVLVMGSEAGQTDFTRPKNLERIRAFLVKQIIEPEIPVAGAGEK
jgi:pimeloyl-ACP methyl ester carboxylesterase